MTDEQVVALITAYICVTNCVTNHVDVTEAGEGAWEILAAAKRTAPKFTFAPTATK